jgi:MarR family 2-MHQ and catechol resistance regulon transcriptional repressor
MQQDTSGIHTWLIMLKAYHVLSRHAERSIAASGLCFSDFIILEALLHKGPLPVNSLGDKLLLTSGALTTAVDRLEKKSLVERKLHETDRRARIVHLTTEGRQLIQDVFDQHRQDFEEIMSILSSAERGTLITLLKKLGTEAQVRL